MSTGLITYVGPSVLDGGPIVSIITGLEHRSANPKTGPMAQHWILRADRRPFEAVRDGTDATICGLCPLRKYTPEGQLGTRRCYVNPMGPTSVYNAWVRGNYPQLSDEMWSMPLRMGAYGDPAALPIAHIADLVRRSLAGHTGYTHQWRDDRASGYRPYLMASTESTRDTAIARARGWRTFRVGHTVGIGEIACPASPEAGHRTTCHKCRLCDGSRSTEDRGDRRKSIVIQPHGPGGSGFPDAWQGELGGF